MDRVSSKLRYSRTRQIGVVWWRSLSSEHRRDLENKSVEAAELFTEGLYRLSELPSLRWSDFGKWRRTLTDTDLDQKPRWIAYFIGSHNGPLLYYIRLIGSEKITIKWKKAGGELTKERRANPMRARNAWLGIRCHFWNWILWKQSVLVCSVINTK